MRTLVRIVVFVFGTAAIALFAGSQDAEAAPAGAIRACIDVDAVGLGAGCEDGEAGGLVDADVVDDVAGQVAVCGNAVAVFGDGAASCDGTQDAGGSTGGGSADDGWVDVDAIGSTTAQATVCGNAVAVGGDASASCDGRQTRGATSDGGDDDGAAVDVDVLRWGLVVQATACGNAVGVLGEAEAACDGTQDTEVSGGDGAGAVGPATARVVVCGNTVAAAGGAQASCGADADAPAGGTDEPPAEPGPILELPDPLPETDILPAGGVGGVPGVVPNAGGDVIGLLAATVVLLALGLAGITTSRSVRLGGRSSDR